MRTVSSTQPNGGMNSRTGWRHAPVPFALSTTFLGLFVFFFVNWNRVQVFGFEYLTAVQATHVVDAVPPVEKLGSLVLTTLHSEVTPILDRGSFLSSV